MSSDRFTSLVALRKQLGKDSYRIRLAPRNSPITVIAPHGGFIEPGTSAIAKAVADQRYNLFDFQGLVPDLCWDMHVTATNFREPRLSKMLQNSISALAIHGMHSQGTKAIWLGGLNKAFKALVQAELVNRGFEVNPDSPRYRGESARNVVNLAQEKGVQLELSNELMADLFVAKRFTASGRCPRTTRRFDALVQALQEAIRRYVESQNKQSQLEATA